MDEQEEKAFGIVAIVLLLMIALLDDGTTILALLAVAIPVLGQITFVLDKMFALIAAVVINGWFIFRLRTFGRSGIANVAGGILEEASIPATFITTLIAIWMANHPKVAAVVGKVTTAATAAAGGRAKGEEGAPQGAEPATARAPAAEESAKSQEAKGAAGEPVPAKPEIPGEAFGERKEAMAIAKEESFGIPEPKKAETAAEEPPEKAPEGEKKREVTEEQLGLKEGPGKVRQFEDVKRLTSEMPTPKENRTEGPEEGLAKLDKAA